MVGYRKKKRGHSIYESSLLMGREEASTSVSDNPRFPARKRRKTAERVFAIGPQEPSQKPGDCENPGALVNLARARLGHTYLGRPLRHVELARLAGLGADHVARLAKGKATLSGPVEVVIRMLLAGHRSPWHEQALRVRPRGMHAGRSTLEKE